MSFLRRRGVGVIEVHKMLRRAESVGPVRAIEVRKLAEIGGDGVEPLVEDHMKLSGHPPGIWIENEGYAAGVFR